MSVPLTLQNKFTALELARCSNVYNCIETWKLSRVDNGTPCTIQRHVELFRVRARRRGRKRRSCGSFDFEKLFRAAPRTAVLVRIPRIRFICFYLTAEQSAAESVRSAAIRNKLKRIRSVTVIELQQRRFSKRWKTVDFIARVRRCRRFFLIIMQGFFVQYLFVYFL